VCIAQYGSLILLLHHHLLLLLIIIIIISGTAAQRGLWPPCSRGFVLTHDTPQSVGLPSKNMRENPTNTPIIHSVY
jgi:hypothetical protein